MIDTVVYSKFVYFVKDNDRYSGIFKYLFISVKDNDKYSAIFKCLFTYVKDNDRYMVY